MDIPLSPLSCASTHLEANDDICCACVLKWSCESSQEGVVPQELPSSGQRPGNCMQQQYVVASRSHIQQLLPIRLHSHGQKNDNGVELRVGWRRQPCVPISISERPQGQNHLGYLSASTLKGNLENLTSRKSYGKLLAMGQNDDFPYTPLTTDTQTRIVVLAPGRGIDPIHCFHLVIDLDAEGKLQEEPGQPGSPSVQKQVTYMEAKTSEGEIIQRFTVPTLRYLPGDGQGLHPFQNYTALSYVWGSQDNLHEIFLNGKPFYVGYNLYMALQQLRQNISILAISETSPPSAPLQKLEVMEHHLLPEGRLLWIDSICINQADTIEREAQVKLMSRIYQQADHVHGYLGHASEAGSQEFLQLLKDIIEAGSACEADQKASAPSDSQKSRSRSHGGTILSALESQWYNYESKDSDESQTVNLPTPAASSLEDHGIPPEDDIAWTYWRRFMDSPYFQRLWIIQEFSLAKAVTLWFSDVGIEPDMIARCLEYMTRYSVIRGLYCTPKHQHEAGTELPTSVWGFIALITQRRSLRNFQGPLTQHLCLLDTLALARRSSATDMRDKIFGLLGVASDGTDFYHLVSYSRSVEEVYQDYARSFVQSGQGIAMLHEVDSRISTTQDIPTWVPDWSRPIDDHSMHAVVLPKLDAVPASKTPIMQCFGSKLAINGLLIDAVDRLCAPMPHGLSAPTDLDVVKFLWEGGNLLTQCNLKGPDAVEILLSTLLCGPLGLKSAVEVDRIRQGMIAIFGHMVSMTANDTQQQSAWRQHTRHFLVHGLNHAIGRRWCFTEKGNFGLVPGGSQEGDRIALLGGSPLPFFLRAVSKEEDTEYALLGHGYIHDLKRRAFKFGFKRASKPKPQTIVLV